MSYSIFACNFAVAASTAVVYDWALTIGKEFELVWRQRWSPMTVIYLTLRSAGILCCVLNVLSTVPSISLTDAGCAILGFAQVWSSFVVNIILGVIIIARLHVMYRSRKMLIFLLIVFMAVTIASGIVTGIIGTNSLYEELVFFGTYQCIGQGSQLSNKLILALPLVFEAAWMILGLSLAAWIVFRHFHEIKRRSTNDRLTALVKTHMIYFTVFAAACCLNLGLFSPDIVNFTPGWVGGYYGVTELVQFVQMFVLGPCLILDVRENNYNLATTSDAGTSIQLFPRSAPTTRRLTVMYDTGDEQQVLGTRQGV